MQKQECQQRETAAEVDADTAHLSNPCCLQTFPLSEERGRKGYTVGGIRQSGNITPFSSSVIFAAKGEAIPSLGLAMRGAEYQMVAKRSSLHRILSML